MPGVEQVTSVYTGPFKVGFEPAVVHGDRRTRRTWCGRRSMSLVSGSLNLGRDGLLVDEPTATSDHLRVGSTVTARFADGGTETLRVDGIYAKNQLLDARGSWRCPPYTAHTAHPAGLGLMMNTTRRTPRRRRPSSGR